MILFEAGALLGERGDVVVLFWTPLCIVCSRRVTKKFGWGWEWVCSGSRELWREARPTGKYKIMEGM
jgi:hypothetical protein